MSDSFVNDSVEASASKPQILAVLEKVCDPEIPTLSILDLGILRDVVCHPKHLEVVITPTYCGCPAMKTIEFDVIRALDDAGYKEVKVTMQLAPPWTTDWISKRGRAMLLKEGIAPPVESKGSLGQGIKCPRCTSHDVSLISVFGSTACKSLYRCGSCLEPFDYFKCH